jgi:hypothetical protein
VGGALVWVALATASVHPHEISYLNETVGGVRQGWRYLLDSNYDWGQDLADLREWMRREGVASIPLGYFGTARPEYYGIRYEPLPSFLLPGGSQVPERWPPRGRLAVSASCYWGLPWPGENPYAFLHGLEPVGRAGPSILIFEVPGG